MAEQAINTIYLLGEQPDALCTEILKNLTQRAFTSDAPAAKTPTAKAEAVETDTEADAEGDVTVMADSPSKTAMLSSPAKTVTSASPSKTFRSRTGSEAARDPTSDQTGSFGMAQLVFAVGHTAIKHIVYLELVEREFKRRKDETAKRERLCVLLNVIELMQGREGSGEGG